MKPSRLFAFHLVYVTVILTFLANIARAEDVLKTTEVQTQPSQSAHFIQFADGLLTVKVKDVSLNELLDEISRQSGLSVVGSGSLHDRITIEFRNLPLDEGMRLILRHHSFALAYAQQTPEDNQSLVSRPETLWIFSKGGKGYPIKTTVVDRNRRRGSPKVVPPDIRSLQVALMSGDSSEREDAVDALGESKRLKAVPVLRLALEDVDEDVREAAVDALAEIGGETAIRLLEQALADEDESIRETAADILAELTAPKARVHPSSPKP